MSKSDHDVLRARYEEALHRLAVALELEYAEVRGISGDIEEAATRAAKIVGFFQSPDINNALQEVILVSRDFQASSGKTTGGRTS